jgi:hypothetical protein
MHVSCATVPPKESAAPGARGLAFTRGAGYAVLINFITSLVVFVGVILGSEFLGHRDGQEVARADGKRSQANCMVICGSVVVAGSACNSILDKRRAALG